MIGLALIGVGAVLVWAAFTKRGDAVISALQINLPSKIDTSGIGGINLGGGSGSSEKGQYQVPIQGPDGTTGSITVNASDPTAATQNASQGGNVPIGDPVKVG